MALRKEWLVAGIASGVLCLLVWYIPQAEKYMEGPGVFAMLEVGRFQGRYSSEDRTGRNVYHSDWHYSSGRKAEVWEKVRQTDKEVIYRYWFITSDPEMIPSRAYLDVVLDVQKSRPWRSLWIWERSHPQQDCAIKSILWHSRNETLERFP